MCEPQLVAARCIQLVSEQAMDQPVHTICSDHQLRQNLGLDSLDQVELVIALEDEFAIELSPADEASLTSPTTTVLDLILAVERHLSAKETMK